MTRIDFYVLGEQARGDRHLLACRLADKIYRQGRRIYIHTASDEEARHLDRLLWTFRQGSFIPHGRSREADPSTTPVLIGWEGDSGDENDVLINLVPTPEAPPFFSRFERVAEPVDLDPQVRQAARSRYGFYRDRGYPLESHNIEK